MNVFDPLKTPAFAIWLFYSVRGEYNIEIYDILNIDFHKAIEIMVANVDFNANFPPIAFSHAEMVLLMLLLLFFWKKKWRQ